MFHLGTHFDAWMAHLSVLGLHLGAYGADLGVLGNHFGHPGLPFRGSQEAPWQHFVDVAGILWNTRKFLKNLGFSLVFRGFQGFEEH